MLDQASLTFCLRELGLTGLATMPDTWCSIAFVAMFRSTESVMMSGLKVR